MGTGERAVPAGRDAGEEAVHPLEGFVDGRAEVETVRRVEVGCVRRSENNLLVSLRNPTGSDRGARAGVVSCRIPSIMTHRSPPCAAAKLYRPTPRGSLHSSGHSPSPILTVAGARMVPITRRLSSWTRPLDTNCWRPRRESNPRWRFCRPLPYHLATWPRRAGSESRWLFASRFRGVAERRM